MQTSSRNLCLRSTLCGVVAAGTVLAATSGSVYAATFTVINTGNTGPGSLRKAINDANALPGADTIAFNIPGAGVQTIAPLSALPTITGPVTIDGYTQPGANPNTQADSDDAVILIELNGANAGTDVSGLKITGGNCVVRGLCINRFNLHGILMHTRGGNVVSGNFIGTNPGGTLDQGNNGSGVAIPSGNNNRIGGVTPAERNLISGNDYMGVQVASDLTLNNKVQGNFIGLDKSGQAALSNAVHGVYLRKGTRGNLIGGTVAGARNVIGLNGQNGIRIADSANLNQVQGNYIGIDAGGTLRAANLLNGVLISDAPNNTIGGTVLGARNVILADRDRDAASVNTGAIRIEGDNAMGNQVQGNYIGTDVTGTLRPVPANDRSSAIGVQIVNAPHNTVGGTDPEARNIVSGNFVGFRIEGADATGNQVLGNLIGTDVTGTKAIGNGILPTFGVTIQGANSNTIGGSISSAGNVISGNTLGITLGDGVTGNRVLGNKIGTDLTGTANLGNLTEGIIIRGSNNAIGGTNAGEGNIIAFNGFDSFGSRISSGVAVTPTGMGNAIVGNSIFSNGILGIELEGFSTNDPGDPDTGANNLQNNPILSNATAESGVTTVTGTFNSVPKESFALDFYITPTLSPLGGGEGKTYLGRLVVHTGASGDATFNFQANSNLSGQFITATATRVSTGDTSILGLAVKVAGTTASE